MTTDLMDTEPAAEAPSALARLTAEHAQYDARRGELAADLQRTERELVTARMQLGEAIAAGADASAIHERIREHERQADGLKRAQEIIATRIGALDGPMLAERRRLATADADEARGAFQRARGALQSAAETAITQLRALHDETRRLGNAANAAAMRADQLHGRQLTAQSAVQVFGGTVYPVPLAHLLDALELYGRETGAERGFAEMREAQRRDQMRANTERPARATAEV